MDTASDRFSFLGREFLTWLWFETERSPHGLRTASFDTVGVTLHKRLLFKSGGNFDESSLVSAEEPCAVEEARTALQSGKKVAETQLVLQVGELQYALKLGTDLRIAAAKLPTELQAGESHHLAERLRQIEQLEGVVDELFAQFVRLRIQENMWAPIREAMRQWVARDAKAD
jgi:hypothetical protein